MQLIKSAILGNFVLLSHSRLLGCHVCYHPLCKAEKILWMFHISSSTPKTFSQIEYWQQPFAVFSHSWLLFLSPEVQPVLITQVYWDIRRDWKKRWKKTELLKIGTLEKNMRPLHQSGKGMAIIFINVTGQQK